MTSLPVLDLAVVAIYAVCIFGLAQWVSREKPGHAKNTSDYFLASKNLPWWAIGASLIAANISAEQIVGIVRTSEHLRVRVAREYEVGGRELSCGHAGQRDARRETIVDGGDNRIAVGVI